MQNFEDVGSDLLHFHNAIQYVGIYENRDKAVCKFFKSTEGELEAQHEDLAAGANERYHARLGLSQNLGKPLYSFTQYEKTMRITFYHGNYMILVRTKPIDDYDDLIKRIQNRLKELELFMHE